MLSFTSASAVAFSSMPACPAQFVYAEKLTDLDQDSTKDFYVPPDDCFYPITLPSLEAVCVAAAVKAQRHGRNRAGGGLCLPDEGQLNALQEGRGSLA